jgi:hypothetical protein
LAGGINATNAFEEVIVTGIMTFTKDQAILPESLSQLDPVISARLYACADQGCNAASSTPLSITNNTWLQEVTCQQALEIMQSLQIN